MRGLTHLLLNEGVVCEGNPPPPNFGLASLQNELTNRLQVGKSIWNITHLGAQKKKIKKKRNHFEKGKMTMTHPQAM